MTRKEFIRMCGILGISIPFQSHMTSCNNDENMDPTKFSGSVLIVGAGAAGMTSGYLLAQQGIDFQILEASSIHGGRMKTNKTFADFPIPMGAEWLHVEEKELRDIVNNGSVQITTQLQEYNRQDQAGYFEDGELTYYPLSREFGNNFIDKKFVNATWLTFFEEYIFPHVQSKIKYNTPIVSVNYESEKVIVTDASSQTYEADKLIIAVPLKILQEGLISFTPELPDDKLGAIRDAHIWGGFKAFIEFSEKFYPVYLSFPDSETRSGQRIYYDAAYGQDTTSNILGLFAVGVQAEQYQNLNDTEQRDYILNELDHIFDNTASRTYVKHIVQNWNDEPFIRAAYLEDDAPTRISRRMSRSVDDKLYFAGDAYTQEADWSAVHNAARSARDAIEEITG